MPKRVNTSAPRKPRGHEPAPNTVRVLVLQPFPWRHGHRLHAGHIIYLTKSFAESRIKSRQAVEISATENFGQTKERVRVRIVRGFFWDSLELHAGRFFNLEPWHARVLEKHGFVISEDAWIAQRNTPVMKARRAAYLERENRVRKTQGLPLLTDESPKKKSQTKKTKGSAAPAPPGEPLASESAPEPESPTQDAKVDNSPAAILARNDKQEMWGLLKEIHPGHGLSWTVPKDNIAAAVRERLNL